MKNIFLVIVLLFSSEVYSQENGQQGGFIHLSQVDKPPLSPGCDVNVALCTANLIENFLVSNITSAGSVTNGISGKTEVRTKVVIDTLGRVSWASVRGLPSATGKKLAERLKEMPIFSPGEHNGQKTNVIVDLITPLYFWEAENFSSEAIHITKVDSQPVWHKCRKAKENTCTHEEVQHWMLNKIDVSKVENPGLYSLTINFVIGMDGKVSRIAAHDRGDQLGNQILKSLQKMPNFEPALLEEEPVAAFYLMPVTSRRMDN